MKDLDTLIDEYYSGEHLSDERIDLILSRSDRARSPMRAWHLRVGALAACLLIGFVALHMHLGVRDTAELVLAEIAMNHRQRHAVDVATADYAVLRNAMGTLGFAPRLPARVMAGFELLGGRYCSIQGGIAVQLRLRKKASGEIHTLYVTALTAKLARLGTRQARRGGVDIDLWGADGAFFGLAHDRAE